MSEKRRALGRGLGALIPSGPATDRPIDVFFRDQDPVTPPSTVPVDDSGQSASESGPHSGDLSGANGAPSTDSDEPTVEAPPSDDGAAATDTGLRPVPGAEFA